MGKTKTLSYFHSKVSEENNGDGGGDSEDKKQNIPLEGLVKENFERTKDYAEDIEAFYGAVGEGDNIWSARALYHLGLLSLKLKQNELAGEIFARIVNDYPDSAFARTAEEKLPTIGNDLVEIENSEHTIRLVKIEVPGVEDASADFVVKKIEGQETNEISKTGAIQENDIFANNRFELLKLEPDKVYLKYNKVDKDEEVDETRFYLGVGDRERKGNYIIELKNINFTHVAKVQVLADTKNDYSEADFLFEIGIEKRAIELSPDKTKQRIKRLNESIEDWQEIADKLGKWVKGMKAACFTTSAILIVKNFLTNLGGGATARQKVMPQWYDYCERLHGNDRNQFNNCLNNNSKGIEQDIENYEQTIEEVNQDLIEMQEANKYKDSETVNRKKVTELYRAKYFDSTISYSYKKYNEDAAEGEEFESVSGSITQEQLEMASLTDLRDLRLNQEIVSLDSSEVARNAAQTRIGEIARRLSKEKQDDALYTGDENGWLSVNRVKFYLTGENKGLVYTGPIPGKYGGKTGFYFVVPEGSAFGRPGGYTDAGDIREFWIQNIGSDTQRDIFEEHNKAYITLDAYRKDPWEIFNLSLKDSRELVNDAVQAIMESNRNYGKTRFNLLGKNVLVDMSGHVVEQRCQDFMSPTDCKILFNVCDPVICPASRCDLGGSYRVDDVVQSGIIGSLVLCLPNFKEGILIPVCLTGLHAGIESFISILKSHRDCLQENLDSGKMVGICDEIYSVYICEFFWRQVGPFLDVLLMKLIEASYGQGMRGGGEYLTVQDAWAQTQASINFLKNDYAVNAYKAFQIRSMGDIGTEFCKVFISAKYPSKGFFDNLIEPDSPYQVHAWMDEILYTEATVPATSQYKVYYHIWAGQDAGLSYQVYLKEPSESAYVHVQDYVVVDTNYIPQGGYVSETKDFTAPAGYKQLCVRINGKDECGFKKVSTSFALNYLSDKYYEDQLLNDVKTTEKCISGSASAYSLLQPNVQEGVEDVIRPSLDKRGIVRVCSNTNPGQQTDPDRWLDVGFCDTEDVRCWVDKDSIQEVIKNKNIEGNLTNKLIEKSSDEGAVKKMLDDLGVIDIEEISSIFRDVKKAIDNLDKINQNTINGNVETYLRNILNTEDTGVAYQGINLKEIIIDLEKVEEKAASQQQRAEAAYYKFMLFYTITDKLADLQVEKITEEEEETEDAEETGDSMEINREIGGEPCGVEEITYSEPPNGFVIRDSDGNYWKKVGEKWHKSDDFGQTITQETKVFYDISKPVCIVSEGTSREKWTLNSSLEKVNELIKRYGGNKKCSEEKEIKDFVDELYEDNILDDGDYENIKGEGVLGDIYGLTDLRNIILEKEIKERRTTPSYVT